MTFESDGSIKWEAATIDGSSHATGSSVFDLDGDGRAEVIYRDDKMLRVLDGTTGETRFETAMSSCTWYELPVIADVDGDGHAEIVTVGNNNCFEDSEQRGVYVFGGADGWAPSRPLWNQHTYHITNINDDGSIPTNEVASWLVYNSYRHNLQPTGTLLGTPLISASSPDSTFITGTQVVLQGLAKAQGRLSGQQPNRIDAVLVNGKAVDSLDPAGNFFAIATILEGANEFRFTAIDAAGQQVATTLELLGVAPGTIDFSRYSDVTGAFRGVYYRTSFDENDKRLLVDLATRNDGQFTSDVPLLVGVENISDPSVTLLGVDGFTPDGIPYYDFSQFVTGGRLQPGQETGSPTITFHNPNRQQFDYDLVFYGKLNEAPIIMTLPKIEAFIGQPYQYDVDASDADSDRLSYTLKLSPAGMTIDSATGAILWTPTASQLGLHDVTVLVADDRGGTAEQRYTVSVIPTPPNRPPVIVSEPVTQAYVSKPIANDSLPPMPVDLSTWSIIQYPLGDQGDASWTLSDGNRTATQLRNADASILLSDFQLTNDRIEGSWRAIPASDDDLMGFVFGYQDDRHYYLFDWKAGDQADPCGFAERGMSVKVVSANSPLTCFDLWPTDGSPGRITNLFHNTIPWELDKQYGFELEFRPGRFTITVRDGDTVLETIAISDDTYTSGGFGFYNYSQGPIEYRGFTRQVLADNGYRYDVEAFDPDADVLAYRLDTAPEGMVISSTTGIITWSPTAEQTGNHIVNVRVSDGRGGTVEQQFTVCVHPDPSTQTPVIESDQNLAPYFTSEPVTTISLGTTYRYQVAAVDPNGDSVSYMLTEAPAGMTFDAASRELIWNPPPSPYRQTVLSDNPVGYWRLGETSGAVAADSSDNRLDGTYALGTRATVEFPFLTDGDRALGVRGNVNRVDVPHSNELTPATISVEAWLRTPEEVVGGVAAAVLKASTSSWDDGYGIYAIQNNEVRFFINDSFNRVTATVLPGQWNHVVGTYDGTTMRIFNNGELSATMPYTAPIVHSAERLIIGDGQPVNFYPWQSDIDEVAIYDKALTVSSIQKHYAEAINGRVTIVASDGVASTTQSFVLKTPATLPNSPPQIDSQPKTQTAFGAPYLYIAHAADRDNETVSYGLTLAPAGMTIDSQGVVRWIPTGEQLGDHTIRVRATDPRGGQDEQQFTLSVVAAPSNTVPFITSAPRLAAIEGQLYEYPATARDADNDPVEWTLLRAPAGMFVDARTGIVRWTPAAETFGTYPVILQARDPLGGLATQRFNVEVRCAHLPPLIVSIPPTIAFDGRSYIYPVRTEDVERDRVAFFLDEAPVGMGIDRDTGLIRWVPTVAQRGEQSVVIRAVDSAGGLATQGYRILVVDPATPSVPGDPTSPPLGNAAPLITSTPIVIGEATFDYQYDVNAIDADGDTVTFLLARQPTGMTIDAATGLIRWTPTASQLGSHQVTVAARDTHGATGTQGFVVIVSQNQPPTITSVAPTTAMRGQTYRYAIRANDPENDPLTYSLAAGTPIGMTIDANNGRILWDTTGRILGAFPVGVVVADDHGHSVTQNFVITVGADTQPPNVSLLVSAGTRVLPGDPITVDINSQVQLRVLASDNVGVVDRRLTIDGKIVSLDPAYSSLVTFDQPGVFSLIASAIDAEGNQGVAQRSIRVRNPNDVSGPTVRILSPADSDGQNNAQVTYITPIIGTVDDPDNQLDFWNVYMARVGDVDINYIDLSNPHYRRIGSGQTEVQAGELAKFDPTLLTNDRYVIFVEAYDISGQGTIRGITLDVDGNAKLGNFRLEFTDLSIPLAGIPIQVNRVYDTLQANDQGDFGFGWSLDLLDGDIRETVPDYGSNLFNIGSAPFKEDTRVYITTPDGRRLGFTFAPELYITAFGGTGFFGPTYVPKFKADPGVAERLDVPEGLSDSNLVSLTADGTAVIAIFGFPYNPDTYVLTMTDGTQYTYDQRAGLQSVVDLDGNTLTVTHDGVFHSSGESIQFARDAQDRITQIVDPDGNLLDYAYDVRGNLVSYTTSKAAGLPVNDDGFSTIAEPPLQTKYAYYNSPAHFLKTITDPLGRIVLEAEFDADGRLIGTTDALGGRVRQDFDPANFTGTITDARGNITQLFYNDRGNVLSKTDPLGGVTRYEYGDPLNPDKETRITDKRGNITDRTYDPRGNVLTITERGSVASPLATPIVTQFAYDASNQVTRITNAQGNATQFAYDSENHLTTIVNALGDSASFTYDDQGRRGSFTDFNGHTSTFEYDNACPCGSPSRVVFADGTYQQFEYNAFGQVLRESSLEADGTLAETRRTKYDYQGRKIVDFGAMGEVTEYHYEGNRLVNQITLIDRIGTDVKIRLTHFEHDAADRVVRQVDTGFLWPTGTNIFDKIAEAVAAAETVVEFRYDANGNRILLQDPVGNITTWIYDANNRVVEERDPFFNLSATGMPLTIDQSLVKLQQPSGAACGTDTPAEHVTLSCYDGEGNRTKKIDRNARRSEFDYDHTGRLTEERWYAAVTSDLVRTITFTYDTLGNMLTTHDPDSNYVFTYDTLNRLTSVDNAGTPGAPNVILTYGYDAQGNVISTSDNFGVTVASTYNERNLLETRKWFDATPGVTPDVDPARVDFLYNAAGRQTRLDRDSDLTATTRVGHTDTTHDLSGRTDTLIHRNAIDELLASYDYGYDFSGLVTNELRDHQDNQFDQSITYGYDLTGQLIDALFSGQDDEHYEYDANGNRLFSRDGTEERTYTTGRANQLESDSQYRYEYDGEGNQIKRIDLTTGETRTFEYDHRNHLIQVDDWSRDPDDPQNPAGGAILTQSVEYTYDAVGRRNSRSEDADGEGPQASEREFFVYNAENIWANFNSGTLNVVRFLYGNRVDENLGRFETNERGQWFLTSGVGTISNILRADGSIFRYTEYASFGTIISGGPLPELRRSCCA